jgi:tripartite-type tricarboxylate transporter receptor subunit TctC
MKKLILMCLLLASNTFAQNIRLVVPFAIGGLSDAIAKLVQRDLSRELNVNIVLDYKPGAGGDIGTAAVINADPRETVLLVHSVSLVTNAIIKKQPFDIERLVPITNLGTQPLIFVTAKTSLLHNIKDWRRNTNTINYGSSGVGTSTHIAGEVLQRVTGKQLNHIPYKGQGQVIIDLLSGNLESAFLWSNFARPYIDSNQIEALAVVAPNRIGALPDIPTFKEVGITGLEFQTFNVLVANDTKNTQELANIQQAMSRILDNKETRAEYENLGLSIPRFVNLPTTFIASEKRYYSKLLSNLKLD